MKRYSKREILREIINGNEEILVYLTRKYFSASRRLLRIRGFRDELTPEIFSEVLALSYSNLRLLRMDHVDFETYFFNCLNEEIRSRKESGRRMEISDTPNQSVGITAQCVSILDEQAQNLLFSRVAENLSYERIAEKFQFSNAIIAQYEVNKAYEQLEGIVKLRMNILHN